ncbi:hypothetical protein GCM10010503_60730 [Streptomyces lucensis JCM 4490]|uniref:Uncharacterized protein n=1 Tax=Streptomyces lucensis JCM 4490 TaxID=1306176 RepID=A0A918JD01_9ACTN|nr:hypothetical protein GCM10010503_60730 [Streptomyces lucensis JCM 4490]
MGRPRARRLRSRRPGEPPKPAGWLRARYPVSCCRVGRPGSATPLSGRLGEPPEACRVLRPAVPARRLQAGHTGEPPLVGRLGSPALGPPPR